MSANVWMSRNPETEIIEIFEPVQFGNSRNDGNDFLNLVTVAGSARTGKSTLMNRLVGSDVFTTSNSRLACTKGVCVSQVQEAGNNGVVAFVDTEGKGNNNINNDNKLLMPAVMLSKVVIFNVSKQVLVERHLDELELFVHIGERVKLPGDQGPLKFGHLIIAVRDYDFGDGTDEEVYNDYFMREESTNNDAVKRNEIREKLLMMFESIQVKLFRHPLNTTQSNSRMEEFKNEIRDKVREPRMFGETVYLTPENVNQITRVIVDQMNTNKKLIVLSTVNLIQRNEINEVHAQCMESLSEIFKIQPDRASTIGIGGILTSQKNGLIQQFENDTIKADFELQYRREKKENLETYFRERLVAKKNVIRGLQHDEINKAERDFQKKLVEKFNRIILPQKDDSRVKESMNQEATRLLESFNQSTNNFDLAVNHQRQTYRSLFQLYTAEIQSRMESNRLQKERVRKAKITFRNQLPEKFRSIPLESRHTFNQKLKNITRECFDRFDQDTRGIDGSSEYKSGTKEKLRLFSDNLEREKRDENEKRQRERTLVDNAKENFERSLTSLFTEFTLPVSQAGLLKEMLSGKEKEYLLIFDGATKRVDLETEHKITVKEQLRVFAIEAISNMIMRNHQKIQDEAISPEGLLISSTVGLGICGGTAAAILGSIAAEPITIIAASCGGGISGVVIGVVIYGIYKKRVHRK